MNLLADLFVVLWVMIGFSKRERRVKTKQISPTSPLNPANFFFVFTSIVYEGGRGHAIQSTGMWFGGCELTMSHWACDYSICVMGLTVTSFEDSWPVYEAVGMESIKPFLQCENGEFGDVLLPKQLIGIMNSTQAKHDMKNPYQ